MGDKIRPVKPVDPQLAIVPYLVELQHPDYRKWFLGGFLKSADAMARSQAEFAQRMGRRMMVTNEPLIAKTFLGPTINLLVEFKASEWPAKLDEMKALFSESIKILIDFSASNMRSVGS